MVCISVIFAKHCIYNPICINCDALYYLQPSAPGDSPLEVRALATSPISITIRWGRVPCINRNSNITGYMVRYSKDGGRTVDVSVSGTGQSDRICTPTLLTPNTSYSIQVAGVSSTGAVGPFSTTITETTLPPECEAPYYCEIE